MFDAHSFALGFVACFVLVAMLFAAIVFLWIRSGENPDPLPLAYLRVRVGLSSYIEGFFLMRLTNEQRVLVTVVALTVAGNPAPIDGDVIFGSSDGSVADIDRVDSTSAYVRAVGPGAAQITASFDADLGEGVRTIELSGAIEVVPAEAERGELQFGEPELIPAEGGVSA